MKKEAVQLYLPRFFTNNKFELWRAAFIQDDLVENSQGLPFHFSLGLTGIIGCWKWELRWEISDVAEDR